MSDSGPSVSEYAVKEYFQILVDILPARTFVERLWAGVLIAP